MRKWHSFSGILSGKWFGNQSNQSMATKELRSPTQNQGEQVWCNKAHLF
jgi:hypothetical protein